MKRSSPRRRLVYAFLIGLGIATALGAIGMVELERVGPWAIVRAPNAGHLPAVGPLAIEIHDVKSPRGTIFVLHGVRDRKESMRGWAEHLVQAGFRAVLVDALGHGESPGEWLSYGIFDAQALSELLNRKGLAVGPVGVMGISYGAATAIKWAGSEPRIHAVIAVAPFESLRKVVPIYFTRLVPVLGHLVPDRFIQRAVDRAGRLGGYDPDAANAAEAITRTQAKILLIHGDRDRHIPMSHSVALKSRARDRAELVIVIGATHDTIAGSAELWPPVLRFLSEHFHSGAPAAD